ncbi:MAG TPA: hydroxymethylglutaryl-CoA lyase [Tepidanaerobacteraceae bacterium]|nr:hydroxymethylglutaryl-CoA lyase [Tepidanaerobacteraceae bacterium]
MINWPNKVIICEVGPRDGLQIEKTHLATSQKIELIEMAAEAGAKVIEIGSFVHPRAVPQMADTDEVAKKMKRKNGVEYRALVMNLKGVERAKEAGIIKVKLTVSASRSHSLNNLNKTPEEAIRGFNEIAEYAAVHNITLSGAISTAFGCPFEGRVPLEQVIKVISCFCDIGVKEISLSDTTGMATPRQVFAYCSRVKELFPDVIWNLHFHNTRGVGFANVVAGMMAGVDRLDASFAGLGGCPFAPGASGNIATEDLVHMCHEMEIETDYDLDAVISLGRYIQRLIGHETSSFILKAGKSCDIVGSFKHKS